MSTETEMILRLREERKRAEARALEYAKYADTLKQGLIYITCLKYAYAEDLQHIAQRTLIRAEEEFDNTVFSEAVL